MKLILTLLQGAIVLTAGMILALVIREIKDTNIVIHDIQNFLLTSKCVPPIETPR